MIYTACFVKNIDTVNRTYLGKELAPNEEYQVPDNLRDKWATDNSVLTDIVSGLIKVGNGTIYYSTFSEQIAWIRNEYLMTETKVTSSTPFAEPSYRTKIDAIPTVVTIEIGGADEYKTAVVDFLITEELHVSGGELGVTNVQIGDYITAEVYDKDSVIPEAYRSALCESWPSVAKYIKKCWMILKTVSTNASLKVDTKPLTAKIIAGLYLRVTYYAKNTGLNRQIVMNYDLTKKL